MLSQLNALIGFAAVFAILSLLITTSVQVIRRLFKLDTRRLQETLRNLFGELLAPERFVAALLTHPSLAGRKGRELHELLVNPVHDNAHPGVRQAIETVLHRRILPWSPITDLDKQTIKDIGQIVYEQIGERVDYPLAGAEGKPAPDWATKLKSTLETADKQKLGATTFRGRLWARATAAFPETEGKASALKTYVAAFHDEASNAASDAFKGKIRLITIALASALVLWIQVDAVATWNRMARATPEQTKRMEELATNLDQQLRDPALNAGSKNQALEAFKTSIEAGLLLPSGNGVNPLGLLLSIVALSLGAPFWFEALKSTVQLKSAFSKGPKA